MDNVYVNHFVSNRLNSRSLSVILMLMFSVFSAISGNAQCSNVTWGGAIGSNQTGNVGYNPSSFLNVNSPTGGSGTLQYMWLYKSSSTDWQFQAVSGASSANYDCPALDETTTFRRCARRSGCSSWDGESNDVTVTINCTTCNNVTDGGTIGSNQSGCTGFDASPFTNIESPSGGSGALEIIWMYWNASTNWDMTTIPGANGLTYDPGVINEDTYFRRCTRRQGCTNYNGESNDIFIDITPCCNASISEVNIYNLGNGTSTPLVNGATYFVSSLPASWNIEAIPSGTTAESVVFDWSGSYTTDNTQNATPFRSPDDNGPLNLGAGSYTLNVRLYSQDDAGGLLCDEETFSFTISACDNVTNGGQIGIDQNGCVGFDPAAFSNITDATGGSGALEYKWYYKNASTGNNYQIIAGASSATYDAGSVFQSTTYKRAARRAGCSAWDIFSNEVVVTISGECTPEEICEITGYESLTGRIFWIPNYGTDFRSAQGYGGVHFAKYSNGTAHMYGVVERISNLNHRFAIDIWFENLSTYAEWLADGKFPKEPQLGDESSWLFYDFSTTHPNTLIGQGSLSGVTLYLSNQDPDFGLQLGNGANSLNGNANGISAWFSYTGSMTGNGDINGSYNCEVTCNLHVEAGPGGNICYPEQLTINSTVTGAYSCETQGNSDCNHSISSSGGWLENLNAAGVCGDNSGVKLWTQSGNGTSYIVLDMGTNLDAGTQICVRMKLEHCSNSNTSYSSAKIQGSLNSGSGFTTIANPVTFSQSSYQDFCYNLATSARYIKISDNGNCAFRVDYVQYITSGTSDSSVDYSWSGPGIVGSSTGSSITVNMAGAYVVTVTDCYGCSDSDTVQVTTDDLPPVFGDQQSSYDLGCTESVPLIQPVATDNNGAVTYTYEDINTCLNNTPTSCDFKTYTQGGWGAPANGNNPGVYRNANFAAAFPAGLVIGCEPGNSLTLTSAQAVQDFLPSGSTPSALTQDYTNPGNAYNNVLAGQLVALTLSLGFDAYDPNFAGSAGYLGNQIIGSGTFEGMSISQVVAIANQVIGGCSNQYAFSELNSVLTSINENFDGGSNGGFVDCVDSDPSCACTWHRRWTATDLCGNTATFDQYFTTGDNEGPAANIDPADENVQCLEDVPAAPSVTFTDDCGEVSENWFCEEMYQLDECTFQIVRMWMATDGCNITYVDQIINVHDTIDPEFNNLPDGAEVECGYLPVSFVVTATDNCDDDVEVNFTYSDSGSGCNMTRTFEFTAEDNCGNMISATRVFSVYDNEAPELIGVPASLTVECDEIPSAAPVTAIDNCDEMVDINFSQSATEGCPYTITRTWTATDECDNSVVATQTITVIDETAPELHGVPADMTLQCDQIAPEAVVSATDNCDNDLVVSHDAVTNDLECGSIFTRTWSVTDACGNTTTASQVITFVDTTDPYVTQGVPAELIIECDQEEPYYMPEFADNCDDTLSLSAISGIANVSLCGYDIQRSWTATDDCGNSITVSQVIHVVDTTDPELVGVPANTEVECDAIPAPAEVTATDNCSAATVSFEQTMTDGCPYTITRTWTATDECGNQTEASQVITVVDTTDPYLIGVPADETVECSSIPAPAVVTAGDNCTEFPELGFNEAFVPGDACTYTLVRTWSAVDACGNMISESQTLTVTDTTDPELVGVPENITVECDEIPAAALVSGTDNCDDNVEIGFSQSATEGCPYTITRTWTATDNCGNAVSASQVLTVIDETAPELHGVPADMTLQCDQIAPEAVVSATDNCDNDLVVSHDAVTNDLECGSIFTRTWSVTDACGNTTTASQVITFVDTTDPYVTQGVPAELIIECDQEEPYYMPEFADNCDDTLSLSAISGIANVSLCGYDIQRSWTATDDCGNSITVSQVIHVVDTTDPELVGVPANTEVECDAIPAPAEVTATDNCSAATVSFEQTMTEGCPYTITRTWTATDECGNQTEASQVITVVDTTDPYLIGVPADETVECSSIPAPAVVTAGDNCTEFPELGFNEAFVPGDACTYTLVRTWSAVDACGNMISESQTLTVTDTTDPELVGVPENITVECDEIPAAAQVSGTDNCDDNVEIGYSQSTTEGCPYTITRTWTATDNCGNAVSASQVLTVIDETAPELQGVPADMTLQCDQIAPEAVVSATDNCDNDLVVSLNAVTNDLECGSIFTRTWSVTDACGNTTTASQVITFVDTTDPYVTQGVPAELIIECDQEEPYYMPEFADNCDDTLSLSAISGIANVSLCGYDIQRSWTATDDCGNSITVSQVIHVVDTTDPELVGVPANTEVECDAIPAPAEVTATDNCSAATVSFEQTMTEGCPYTITRTWTATDACGNQTEASQVITVVDTTDPFIVVAPDMQVTVQCGNEVPYNAPVFGDNCDQNLEVGFDEIEVSGSCLLGLMRTWTATDNCGNSVSFVQFISIIDTIAPTFDNLPVDETVECDEVPVVPVVTASDLCDEEVGVLFSEETTEGCPYTITRTWTAIDDCENVTIGVQVITVVDTHNPVLHGVPVNVTIECDQPVPGYEVWVTDNCDDLIDIDFSSEEVENECGSVITRTWSATDDCGNIVTATQSINITDTTDPYIVEAIPAELTIVCDMQAPVFTPQFADNCDNQLSVNAISGLNNVSACGYDIERSWTATDDCGNAVTIYQVIHVVDTIDPELEGVPSNTVAECDAIPAPAEVTATDNCSVATVSFEQTMTEGCPYTITRTWTATDECGNETSASQVITVVDNQDPYLSNGAPISFTIECGQEIPSFAPVFADNCDQNLDIVYDEDQVSGSCPGGVIRMWTVTDNCGNSIVFEQIVFIHDNTDPSVIEGVPAELTIQCDATIPQFTPLFSDVCDSELTITAISGVSNVTECGYDIERSWTAMDDCENATTISQIIHVVDTTDPSISGNPQDATYECLQEVPAPAVVSASDNCDVDVAIEFSEEQFSMDCGYQLIRTWRATDNCGNQAVESQYIYVLDETEPVVTGVPADITIQCNETIPAPVEFFATDNCDNEPAMEVVEMYIQQSCGYQIKRYYNATDDCGNMTSVPQIITIVDTTAPTMEAPADLTVSCENVPSVPVVTAIDNCDEEVSVVYSEEVEGGCPYNIIRTWTATDNCGNETVVSQMITVYDEVNPVFDAFEPFVFIECDEVGSYMLTATDNCDSEVEVTVIEELNVSGACYGSLLRTYQATDNCGNSVTAFQIVDIVDNTAPQIVGVPAGATINCGDEVPSVPEGVFATDNCTVDMNITFTEIQTNEFCPFDIIRTWTVSDDCGNTTTAEQVIHVNVEVPNTIHLLAYPNPAKDVFTLEFSTPYAANVKGAVYDVLGREVMPLMNGNADGGRAYKWTVDAANFDAGSYNVRMIVGDDVHNERVMISNK